MRNPWARRKRRQQVPKYRSKYHLDSDIAIQLMREDGVLFDNKNEQSNRLSFMDRFKRFF